MNKILISILFLFVALAGCKKDPVNYTITSSVSAGGTIDPLGVTSVEEGSSVIYTIKPDDHYSIASIKVDGVEAPVSGTVEIKNIKSNKVIRVEFVKSLTITASVEGADGVIDPKGILKITEDDLTKGKVIYHFIPDSDYVILSVTLNGVKQNIIDDNKLIITKLNKGDSKLIATFISMTYLYITMSTPFYYGGYKIIQNDSVVYKTNMSIEEQKSFTLLFNDSTIIVSDGSSVNTSKWTLDGNNITIASQHYVIVSSSEKELILYEYGKFHKHKPCIYEHRYWRP